MAFSGVRNESFCVGDKGVCHRAVTDTFLRMCHQLSPTVTWRISAMSPTVTDCHQTKKPTVSPCHQGSKDPWDGDRAWMVTMKNTPAAPVVRKRMREYRLYAPTPTGPFSVKSVSYPRWPFMVTVCARSVRQAYYLAGHGHFASDPRNAGVRRIERHDSGSSTLAPYLRSNPRPAR